MEESSLSEKSIYYTILKNNRGHLRKEISQKNGKISKKSCAQVYYGRVTVCSASDLFELKAVIKGLRADEALVLGVPVGLKVGDSAAIYSRNNLPPEGGLTRTKACIVKPPGRYLVMIDYDGDLITLEEFLKRFFAAAPQFKGAEMIVVPSSSAGIRHPDGSLAENSSGFHIYFIAESDVELSAIKDYLHHRMWLSGEGRIDLSVDLKCLVRCFVDLSTLSFERINYEAPPLLLDGLTRDEPFIEHHPGHTIAAVPEVTESERAEVEELIAAAKAAKKPEADRSRKTKEKTMIKGFEGKHSYAASREITRRFFDGGELSGAYPLEIDGVARTASDLLAWRERFDGCAVADLDGGRRDDRTTIFAKRGEPPKIFSFQHGEGLYPISRQPIQYKYDALHETFRDLDDALSVGTVPVVYQLGVEVVKLTEDGLIRLTPANAGAHIGAVVEFYSMKQGRDGEWLRVSKAPGREFFQAYLSFKSWTLHRLVGVVSAPFVFDGKPVCDWGFHQPTGLFLTQNWSLS